MGLKIRKGCVDCGRPAMSKGKVKGSQTYGKYCNICHKAKYKKGNNPSAKCKKDYCDLCGFVAIHSCQLDVDHIDGNRKNESESNLQTLCANCHRLKTYMNADWEDRSNLPWEDKQHGFIFRPK